MKLKDVLELPRIQHDDQNSLRNYHQKMKTTVNWIKTMGYDGALKSVENINKVVMRLPKILRQKFYREFKIINYKEREMNLKVFENWLGERIYDTNNHLALTVEIEIKKKQQANDLHQKTRKHKYQRFPKKHYRSFAITTETDEDRGSEFSSYKIELRNRVTQNDVTLRVTNPKIFIEILLSSYLLDFVKY